MNTSAYLFGIVIILLAGCQKKETKVSVNKKKVDTTLASRKDSIPAKNTSVTYLDTTLSLENIRINGSKPMVLKSEFEKQYPKSDSIITELWECGNPFEWLDQKWMDDTYGKRDANSGVYENFDGKITTIYTHKASFITNKHLVLFDDAFADKNTLEVVSHHIILNHATSMEEFEKLFPKAKREEGANKDEFQYRFYLGKESENAFFLVFKNGYFYSFNLWWLLC
ncbi:hypothetical protein CHRYSEOSP005_12530 [Chryseobacterium sp. Alg-005]|uniref:hypothetical protein n=1 Tax=Chryseobacterium sp. Alg-005 TaxID=3159516 RepID=UPI0035558124